MERTVDIKHEASACRFPGGLLVVERGSDPAQVVVAGEPLLIGRAQGNSLVLSDPSVSLTHCEVVPSTEGPVVQDLSSTNGLFLCGHQVDRLRLRHGCRFTVGSTTLCFKQSGEQVEVEVYPEAEFGELYGQSLVMRQLFAKLERFAPLNLTLLVTGETGTGKELLARSVHEMSLRANRPFLVLDCGAVSRELIESTLFGHERGAFTGAVNSRPGIFEEAAGGTIFLDEIGDMDLDLQRKLLRVMESRQVTRLGSHQSIDVDVRIIAATNKDLREAINRGSFREDLFFRLAQVPLKIPPLRERREDIPGLALRLLAECTSWLAEAPRTIAPATMDVMVLHGWPGNVRELRNVIQYAASLTREPQITTRELEIRSAQHSAPGAAADISLPFKEAKQRIVEHFERTYLAELMRSTRGNLTHAAERAQIARNHLRALLRERGVTYQRER